jgi:hypothetical protein
VRGLECGALREDDVRRDSGMAVPELSALARPSRA